MYIDAAKCSNKDTTEWWYFFAVAGSLIASSVNAIANVEISL